MPDRDATYRGYEMPPFELVAECDGYELREYRPYRLATVQVPGEGRVAVGEGFRALAAYIFGGNASGEKIAMTVPVRQVPGDEASEIGFMMPRRFDEDPLPEPKDGRIRFRVVPPERLAVRVFSGTPSTAAMTRNAAELRDLLRRDGVPIINGPRYAYYDNPMTLPFRRRNEVAFSVTRAPLKEGDNPRH